MRRGVNIGMTRGVITYQAHMPIPGCFVFGMMFRKVCKYSGKRVTSYI